MSYGCHVPLLSRVGLVFSSPFVRNRTAGRSYSSSAANTQSTSQATSDHKPFRVAVVGSGPAGFYTAYRLLKALPHVRIDMFESLPVPFGLVRFGVAPDHPEVKVVTHKFEEVATSSRFTFIGNVKLGSSHLSLADLRNHYHALVLAYGASQDRALGIPGEDLAGVISARSFVGWYNGLPEHKNLNPDLTQHETALVIGLGNVALDVVRILLAPIEEHLAKTDITEHALDSLRRSKIKKVVLVGRRGPLQVAFTSKEFRELTALPTARATLHDPSHRQLISAVASQPNLPRPSKRLMNLIDSCFTAETDAFSEKKTKEWSLAFLRSPKQFISSPSHPERVGSAQLEINRLEGDGMEAVGTGVYENIECGLTLRSIGYKSVAMEGIPFDSRNGSIENVQGRIVDKVGEAVQRVPGMYTSGWLKRGPTGVIASTMRDGFETADSIISDHQSGEPMLDSSTCEERRGAETIIPLIKSRGALPVSFSDWLKIDALERAKGEQAGKVREKMGSVEEMLKALTTNTKEQQ